MNTYDRVAKWNERCGKVPSKVGSNEYWEALAQQAKRIAEEFNELVSAIENKNLEEVVDGGLDLDVVVAGLNYLSDANYSDGINLVLENNDLKYSTNKDIVQNWLTYWEDNGEDVYLSTSETDDGTFYCVKRTDDDKVLKFARFPKVDLTNIVPEFDEVDYLLLKDKESLVPEEANQLEVILLENLEDDNGFFIKIFEDQQCDALQITIANGSLVNIATFTEEE